MPQASPAANTPPPEVPTTGFFRQVQLVALTLLILTLAIHLLREFATVLQQLCIAAFIAYLILPVHSWFMRRRLPSSLAFVLIVILFLAASFGLGQMIYKSVADFNNNRERYRKNMENLAQKVTEAIPKTAADQLEDFFNSEEFSSGNQMKMLQAVLGTFVGFLSQMVLVLIYLVFILAERLSLTHRLQAGFQAEQAGNILSVVARINASISQYLAVKTFMSLLAGFLTSVVLFFFGVDYAIFWGIIAFLLNFIPYLGSWIAVLFPVLLSLVQFGNPGWALVVLVTLLVIQNGIGYAIEPRIAGSRLNLSPLVIILSLAFWGTIWGIVGMILAVPLVVVIKSILENFPETRPLATLLSNQR